MGALQIFTLAAHCQGLEFEISIDAVSKTASVAGRFTQNFHPANPKNLVFLREATGIPSLAARIRNVELADQNGKTVDVRKLMDGEYLAAAAYSSWSYTVNLSPPTNRTGYAHASWMGESTGSLVLADLLPQFRTRDRFPPGGLKLKLPDGWALHSAGTLWDEDLSRSVVFIGRGHRVVDANASSGDLRLLIYGDWHFTDDEASQMAREIFDEYSKILGSLPKRGYLVALHRFPSNEAPAHWEAETRGRTVTIFSSDMPFRTQSLQRLHEQLRHEIFHLWFPNGIALTGDYAWFYEGFAMYSSLKLAVKLNRIRFEDFLDTLGRAHTIDSNSKPRKALTDASIDPTARYARGMMVAFLTDLKVIGNSGGKNDVGKSLRTLFSDYPKTPHGSPAMDAVRTVVTDPTIVQRFVDGVEIVDWTADLATVGIESKQTGRATTLSVAAKPSGRQKEILDRLGYNNWRKAGTKK